MDIWTAILILTVIAIIGTIAGAWIIDSMRSGLTETPPGEEQDWKDITDNWHFEEPK